MTAQQIVDLRDDIADHKEAFKDPVLQRYWERTAGAEDEFTHLNAVKALCYENLLANASRLHDYTAGATGHKLSQIRAHLKDQYEQYKPYLVGAMGQKREFGVVGLRSFPNPDRTEPGDV